MRLSENTVKQNGIHGTVTVSIWGKGAVIWSVTKDGHQKPGGSKTISLYKLHGSLHFLVKGEKVHLKERPYTKQHGRLRFTIIPPKSNKRYGESIFRRIWNQASRALHRANNLVVIGYSFPVTDSHSQALFRTSVKRESLKSLVLVNPNLEARYRAREVLKRGLGLQTQVIVFDKFEEFVAADRSLWD